MQPCDDDGKMSVRYEDKLCDSCSFLRRFKLTNAETKISSVRPQIDFKLLNQKICDTERKSKNEWTCMFKLLIKSHKSALTHGGKAFPSETSHDNGVVFAGVW